MLSEGERLKRLKIIPYNNIYVILYDLSAEWIEDIIEYDYMGYYVPQI